MRAGRIVLGSWKRQLPKGLRQVIHHIKELLLPGRHFTSHGNNFLCGHYQMLSQLKLSLMDHIHLVLHLNAFLMSTGNISTLGLRLWHHPRSSRNGITGSPLTPGPLDITLLTRALGQDIMHADKT